MSPELHLAVGLDGTGWHPASWRETDARPDELFTARYWTDLVQEAERALLDFVTFEDALGVQSSLRTGPDGRSDQVRGRLDAVLTAARVAPRTSHIGLVPTVVMAHTEPFHISKAIATLDYVSLGRAGVRVQAGNLTSDPAHFGRRPMSSYRPPDRGDPTVAGAISDLFDETYDYIEVVRRLWDSWEDDAEIRDAATGRFIDREKLHYIDFEGRWFRVKGPSITPRPPQGQPIVSVLAHATVPYRLAGRAADVVYVTPRDAADAARIREEVDVERDGAGRREELLVFADLVVFLDGDHLSAERRKHRLDQLDGAEYSSDAHIFVGTADELADLLVAWHETGITGFRLRPGALPHDLLQITRKLVPVLQQRGWYREQYSADTLRGILGLERPENRYTLAATGAPSE